MIQEILFQIVLTVISGLGVSVTFTDLIKKLLGKKPKRDDLAISEKIENVSKTLSQSASELTDLQQELTRKIQYVNDLNAQANQAQNLLSLSHDQVEAIKNMISQETQKDNRDNFWKSVLVNFIFFVLGAIVSYIISKYLI